LPLFFHCFHFFLSTRAVPYIDIGSGGYIV
jgi:hypothetical protein